MDKLLDEPFILSIAAPVKSGKSHLIRALLHGGLIDSFDKIIIMCQSLPFNDDYLEFMDETKYPNKFLFLDDFSSNDIRTVLNCQSDHKRNQKAFERGIFLDGPLKDQKKKKEKKNNRKRKRKNGSHQPLLFPPGKRFKENTQENQNSLFAQFINSSGNTIGISEKKLVEPLPCPRTLLILDDCVDAGVLNFATDIDVISFRGRHIELSVIVSSQRITPISVNTRDNSRFFIIFKPFSQQELESFTEKFVSRAHVKKFRKFLTTLFVEQFTFLLIDHTERDINRQFATSKAEQFVAGELNFIYMSQFLDNK